MLTAAASSFSASHLRKERQRFSFHFHFRKTLLLTCNYLYSHSYKLIPTYSQLRFRISNFERHKADGEEFRQNAKRRLNFALFNERRLTDVTFVVEGEEVKVHKPILAAKCSYFHAMLFGATNEAKAARITLNDTPLKQFKEIIRFCYLKKVKIGGWSTDDVCSLLSLAHEYNYDKQLEEIAKEMRKQSMFNPVSLPNFHDLAVALNLKHVLTAIKLYAKCSLVESEEFVEYSADLVSFISNLLLRTPATIKALWKWKAAHTHQEVEQVFRSICWETVNPKIVAEVIRVLIPQAILSKVAEPELQNETESARIVYSVDDDV